jgi:Saxitoxin biosynthesis operon protein SxtJ
VRWSDLPLHPTTATLRWFAGIATTLCMTLAALQLFVSEHALAALALAGVAGTAGVLGLCYPRLLRPVFVGLMIVSFPLNWLMMHLLLAIVFYCLFTPLALWFKLIGRDVLTRRFESDRASYWVPKTTVDDVRRYFRQS